MAIRPLFRPLWRKLGWLTERLYSIRLETVLCARFTSQASLRPEHSRSPRDFLSTPRETALKSFRQEPRREKRLPGCASISESPLSRTVAVWDQESDLSMIERAGLGVAMARGAGELRMRADLVIERIEELKKEIDGRRDKY